MDTQKIEMLFAELKLKIAECCMLKEQITDLICEGIKADKQ